MSDVPLGKIIDAAAQRDAIHIAIAPVVAIERMYPGDAIGLVVGSSEKVGRAFKPIGIVDPFLPKYVDPGERFFMFLYPQTVTGMRHHWQHPAFADAPTPAPSRSMPDIPPVHEAKSASTAWLENLADSIGLTYQGLMEAAERYNAGGQCTTQMGDMTWQDGLYGKEEEFWRHYEVVTGEKAQDPTAQFFSCSC